ncbi:MAG: beta-galactosidase [Phototrophicaceae bacterium]
MNTRNKARRQVFNFVIIWSAITLFIGACTFTAIYAGWGLLDADSATIALEPTRIPLELTQATVVFPTRPPTVAVEPTQSAEEVAQATTQEATVAPELPTETPTIEPTPRPIDDTRFQLGIQVQTSVDGLQETWMNELKKLNMPWMKLQVRWEVVEPQKGQFDWTALDIALAEATKANIKVMASVVTAPNWSREQGVNLESHGPPANYQDYTNFLRAVLEKYPNQIHAVEVWNEQNIDREWTSLRGIVPSDYVNLLRQSYDTIKSIDPGIIVISGALSPTGFDNRINAWDDFAYMDAMIAAGLLSTVDCVGAHHNGYNVSPDYTWDAVPNDPSATFRGPFDNPHHSWSFRSTLQGYAIRIQQAGGTQKLCVTEFGWPVTEDMNGYPAGFEFANDNTLEEQKEWTIKAVNNMIEWDIVWLAYLWNLNYGAQAGWDPSNDNVPYSIIGNNWNFRPIYGAISEWQAQYRGLTQ